MQPSLILKNWLKINDSIEAACKRSQRSRTAVKVMAVTKYHPVEIWSLLKELPFYSIGENRVQEALNKLEHCIEKPQRLELIGHLQSNKVAKAVAIFDRIQSVDSIALMNKIHATVLNLGKKEYPILIQVNTGRDIYKNGLLPEAASAVLAHGLTHCKSLKIEGLMTIAPLNVDSTPTFEGLRTLREELQSLHSVPLPELSMGMSNDYITAIECGSTVVRIGSALENAG